MLQLFISVTICVSIVREENAPTFGLALKPLFFYTVLYVVLIIIYVVTNVFA